MSIGSRAQSPLPVPEAVADALLVRAFVMSCRVLNRGVEHALIRRLALEVRCLSSRQGRGRSRGAWASQCGGGSYQVRPNREKVRGLF